VRMHTIFYSFICLALALKVQAENFICRDKMDPEAFLQLVESGPYFGLEQRNYRNVPDSFYEKNTKVKVYYGANRDYVATKFRLTRKKKMKKKGWTYISVGLDTPVLLTSKMWSLMCKPPVAQYNCESRTSSGDFLKISTREYKITQGVPHTFVTGAEIHYQAGSVILLKQKSERPWTTIRFFKNESDGSFYFDSSFETDAEPSYEEPYYLWGEQAWTTAVFYRNITNGSANGSYYFENPLGDPVNPYYENPRNPNFENFEDNPNLVFTKERVNEMCRMVAAYSL